MHLPASNAGVPLDTRCPRCRMGSKWPCQFQSHWKQKQKRPGSQLFQQSPSRRRPQHFPRIRRTRDRSSPWCCSRPLILPGTTFPDWSLFWFRDAALVWHFWLNRLIATGDNFFCPLVDGAVHAMSHHHQDSTRYKPRWKRPHWRARRRSPGGGALSLILTCI
ncbi:hypothetical protein EDB84DRAFT_366557 [Lactarius hengduanensis]|nr:hypothetical protein EDB84DRAFT_366557 [Lactarius hengduanensis]